MSSVNFVHSTVDLMHATAELPSTIRVKPSRKIPDSSSVWKCLLCNKPYSDKYCLKKHSKKCIGTVQNAPAKVQSRRHSCSICEKSFVNKHFFVFHIKSYHPSFDIDSFGTPRFHRVLKCPGQLLPWLKYR